MISKFHLNILLIATNSNLQITWVNPFFVSMSCIYWSILYTWTTLYKNEYLINQPNSVVTWAIKFLKAKLFSNFVIFEMSSILDIHTMEYNAGNRVLQSETIFHNTCM